MNMFSKTWEPGEKEELNRVKDWRFKYIDFYITNDQSFIPIRSINVKGKDYLIAESEFYKAIGILPKDVKILKYEII